MVRFCLFVALLAGSPALAQEPKKETEPKPQNELISDFVDNAEKYKGKLVCLQVTFLGGDFTLRELSGSKDVAFTAKDPNNGAKLVLGVDIPKDLKLPDAKSGETVVLTFKCDSGSTSKGNTAVSVTRPKAKP